MKSLCSAYAFQRSLAFTLADKMSAKARRPPGGEKAVAVLALNIACLLACAFLVYVLVAFHDEERKGKRAP